MRSAGEPGDQPEARGASWTRLSSAARPHVRLVVRDLRSFLRLLARTLRSLPADVLAASVVINLLNLALPLAIVQVYDRIVPHSATETLVFLMIGVCCALMLEATLRVARSHVIAWSAMKQA